MTSGSSLWLAALRVIGGVNLGGFLVTLALRSEVVTDLLGTGSIGVAAYLLGARHPAFRVAVCVWSARLSLFLAYRAFKVGDARLRAFLPRHWRDWRRMRALAAFWLLQAAWGGAMVTPALAGEEDTAPLSWLSALGGLLALNGFALEVWADTTKLALKARGQDLVRFPLMQYPSYTGEMAFWLGMGLHMFERTRSWAAFVPVSFVAPLLLFVSGIPLSEKSRRKRFAGNKAYADYVRDVPYFLIPGVY